jgi:hypothetical protein
MSGYSEAATLWDSSLRIPLQLPLAPMRLFAIGESALDAMMHRPEHPDARMQQRAAILCSHDQRLYSGLPVR